MKKQKGIVLMLALVSTLGGRLDVRAMDPHSPAVPVVTLGRALPGAALSVARPAALESLGAEPGCLASAALSQADRNSLWQALSAARREIRAVSGPAAEAEAAAGVRLLASNPGQRLTARFLDSAARIASSCPGRTWRADFSLAGQPAPTALAARDARLEYARGSVIEWYENRPEGLEHGVILRERPVDAGADVRLLVAVSGLRPRVSADEPGALDLVDAQGQAVLRYAKLHVWDADGKILAARLEPARDGISILVADAGARYPVTVDPLITSLEAKLGPELTGSGYEDDEFGYSIGLSGDTAVVGAFKDDSIPSSTDWGSAYVFTRSNAVWSLQAKITPGDGNQSDNFGNAVGISGDTIVVGAYMDDDKGSNSGSAYVFVRSNTVWRQQAKLIAADGAASDSFGNSVGISGDAVVVGSWKDDDKGTDSGSAYVYARSNAVWSLQAKLVAADGAASDWFGCAVRIAGDTALVGAYQDDDKGSNSGSAYVFTRSGTNWSAQAKLTAEDGVAADYFGISVGISEDTAVVGAKGDDVSKGSAYVFTRSGTNWIEQAKLAAEDGLSGDEFGVSVGVSGDTAVAGAWYNDDKASDAGSAYVFARSGTNWTLQAKLVPADGAASDYFGYSVGISGDTVIAGAYKDDDYRVDSGSAYVYVRAGEEWSRQAKLTAGDGAIYDKFGCSVGLSGDTAVVGAYWDDDAGSASGSAFVFIRSNTVWSQQAKLTASDAAASDWFGCSVGVSGDTVVVGAYGDNNGKGTDAGCAYVFTRSNAVWSEQAKLTASDGASSDYFGISVGISGDTALVGAYWHNPAGISDAGGAYVYARTGTNWTQQAKLTASDAASYEYFGYSVGISGDTAVVGSYSDDNANGTDAGSAYVYARTGTNWTQQVKLLAADGAATDYFGWSVGIFGDTVIVGADNDDNAGGTDAGSAYVFTRSNTVWSQQAKLTASDGAASDTFGYSVGISEDRVVVGARADDDKGSASGSAYLFTREGTIWRQRTKFIASDGALDDYFGHAVAVSGKTVIVGAFQDDGLDAAGAPSADQGSVYVYRIKTPGLETVFMVK